MLLESTILGKFIILFINVLGIWLSFWVYSSNKRLRANQAFILTALFALLWVDFAYFARILPVEHALVSLRIAYGVTPLFFVGFYLLITTLVVKKENKSFTFLLVLSSLLVWFFSTFSDFIIRRVFFVDGVLVYILGWGKMIYYSIIIFLLFSVLSILTFYYFRLPKKRKLQIQYFVVGIFIFFSS